MKGECGHHASRHRASPVVSTTTAKLFMTSSPITSYEYDHGFAVFCRADNGISYVFLDRNYERLGAGVYAGITDYTEAAEKASDALGILFGEVDPGIVFTHYSK